MVACGQHGLQQRLTHLGPGVGITQLGGGRDQVVAGGGHRTERRLIHPEQTDDPEGDPPERGQRTDGDAAPEVVGAARKRFEPLVDQPPDIDEVERRRRLLALRRWRTRGSRRRSGRARRPATGRRGRWRTGPHTSPAALRPTTRVTAACASRRPSAAGARGPRPADRRCRSPIPPPRTVRRRPRRGRRSSS